jgi:dihydroflavonol-4-reductase
MTHQLRNQKILVTGAAGLLGSYVLKSLAGNGNEIIAIGRSKIPEDRLSQYVDIRWVQGDILDTSFLEEILNGVDKVYHCAGLVSFNPSSVNDLMKINVEGTANVVNACLNLGVKKLVHVSSVSALGRKRDHATVTENVKWEDEAGLSAYGKSKYLAELEVWRGIAEGLEAVIVNPTVILGLADWDKGSAATFKNAYNEFPWYSGGTGGFVDAKDVATAMVMLMESDISGERFIISAENWPYRKLFTAMAAAFNKKPPHLKATRFLGAIVWRLEALKNLFTSKDPLLTKETAEIAQMNVFFSSEKLRKFLPSFSFRPLEQTIKEYCSEYLVKINSERQ